MNINKDNIEACAQSMIDDENTRLKANGIDQDLIEHYETVRGLLRSKGADKESLLVEFTALLNRKTAAWSPRAAFEQGVMAKGREYNQAVSDYRNGVSLTPEYRETERKLQSLMDEMCEVIGKDDSREVTHYLEYHGTCNGTIQYNIEIFFKAGYLSVNAPEAK